MGKLAEIDAAKVNLSTLLHQDEESGKGLQAAFDEFVEKKACSAQMVCDVADLLERAFELGRLYETRVI